MINLFPKNIYEYENIDKSVELCVYVCDTDNSNEIIVGYIKTLDILNKDFIKLENGLKKVLYLDDYLTLNRDSIKGPLRIKGKIASINSAEFLNLTNCIYKLLLVKYEKQIESFSQKNYISTSNLMKELTFPEKIIKMLTWNINKIQLKTDSYSPSLKIMEHCVYFAYMGTNIGPEIEKLRPVLVWKKHINNQNHNDDAFYVFPISSKIKGKNYNYNVDINIKNKRNIVLINQGKLISIKRFVKPYLDDCFKIIKLDERTKINIKKAIKIYFCV